MLVIRNLNFCIKCWPAQIAAVICNVGKLKFPLLYKILASSNPSLLYAVSESWNLTLTLTAACSSLQLLPLLPGDLMGPTISGLDSLLKMPTGCGEQNMLTLAPDVYVTDYLMSVNQLTSDIKAKALSYMESGTYSLESNLSFSSSSCFVLTLPCSQSALTLSWTYWLNHIFTKM